MNFPVGVNPRLKVLAVMAFNYFGLYWVSIDQFSSKLKSRISSIGGKNDHCDNQPDLQLLRSSSPVHYRYKALSHLRHALSAVKLHYPNNNSLASSPSTHSIEGTSDNHAEMWVFGP